MKFSGLMLTAQCVNKKDVWYYRSDSVFINYFFCLLCCWCRISISLYYIVIIICWWFLVDHFDIFFFSLTVAVCCFLTQAAHKLYLVFAHFIHNISFLIVISSFFLAIHTIFFFRCSLLLLTCVNTCASNTQWHTQHTP